MADPEPVPEGGKSSVVPSGVKGKLGPLPIWAWVVVAAGLLGVIIIIRRGKSSTPTAVGLAAAAPASDGSGAPAPDNSSGVATDPMATEDLLLALKQLTAVMQNQKTGNSTTSNPQSGGGVDSSTKSLIDSWIAAVQQDAQAKGQPYSQTAPDYGFWSYFLQLHGATMTQNAIYNAYNGQAVPPGTSVTASSTPNPIFGGSGGTGGRPAPAGWSTSRTTGGQSTARVASAPKVAYKMPGSP